MAESARKELLARGIMVTLSSPGNVDTPFFDTTPSVALSDEDVARAVMFALAQPPTAGINEILMRHPHPTTGRGPPTPAVGVPPEAQV